MSDATQSDQPVITVDELVDASDQPVGPPMDLTTGNDAASPTLQFQRVNEDIKEPSRKSTDWYYVSSKILLELYEVGTDKVVIAVHDDHFTTGSAVSIGQTVEYAVPTYPRCPVPTCAIRGWRWTNSTTDYNDSLFGRLGSYVKTFANWVWYGPVLEFLVSVHGEWCLFAYQNRRLRLLSRRCQPDVQYYLTNKGIAGVRSKDKTIYISPPGSGLSGEVSFPRPVRGLALYANEDGFAYIYRYDTRQKCNNWVQQLVESMTGTQVYYGSWMGNTLINRGPIHCTQVVFDRHYIMVALDERTVIVDNLRSLRRVYVKLPIEAMELIAYDKRRSLILFRSEVSINSYHVHHGTMDVLIPTCEFQRYANQPVGRLCHWQPDTGILLVLDSYWSMQLRVYRMND